MAINVLRNVCLTRVRTVYLIRYNLPWRRITYCHFKNRILHLTTIEPPDLRSELLITKGESSIKVYRETALINHSNSYSFPRSRRANARQHWHKG